MHLNNLRQNKVIENKSTTTKIKCYLGAKLTNRYCSTWITSVVTPYAFDIFDIKTNYNNNKIHYTYKGNNPNYIAGPGKNQNANSHLLHLNFLHTICTNTFEAFKSTCKDKKQIDDFRYHMKQVRTEIIIFIRGIYV